MSCETIEVHPLNKKEIAFSADYRAVPIYIDSKGVQVNDSTPIMRHIDREFPDRKTFREDAAEEKWLAWSEGLVKGLPAAVYNTFPNSLKAFNYITKTGNFSWFEKQSIRFSGALVMTLVAKKVKKREGISDPDLFLKQKAKEWTDGLGGRPFMGGENPGAADIAVYGILRAVAGLPAEKTLLSSAEFSAWMGRMKIEVSNKREAGYVKS